MKTKSTVLALMLSILTVMPTIAATTGAPLSAVVSTPQHSPFTPGHDGNPLAPVTFDPLNKAASVTLSNSDLTMTAGSTAWQSAMANACKSAGKWYYEVVLTTSGVAPKYHMTGVAQVTADTGWYVGKYADGWGYQNIGNKYTNGVSTAISPAATTPGDIVMVALDMDTGKVWFGVNGVWCDSGNPSVGTGEQFSGLTGSVGPMSSLYTSDNNLTGKFAAADLTYTPPTGFIPFTSSP